MLIVPPGVFAVSRRLAHQAEEYGDEACAVSSTNDFATGRYR